MTKTETARILAILASVWSNETIDDAKITAYQWALSDVTYSAAEQAAKTILQTAKFFPKPSELIELANASEPSLDAKLYRQYADLRRQLQAGELGKRQSSELIRIERKLGLPTGGDRPVPLRELAS